MFSGGYGLQMVTGNLLTSSPRRQRANFAWQSLELSVPAEWNPVAISGNFAAGQALLAEFGQPRLGIRWKKVRESGATAAVLERIARREADADPKQQVNHLPPNPEAGAVQRAVVCLARRVPGRDVCVAWSAASGRLVQLVCHAPVRDHVLVDDIIPTLRDIVALPWQRWAILDMACAVPAGFTLDSHELRAGDSRLAWRGRRGRIAVRQLALADRVLQRRSMEQLVRDRQHEQQHSEYSPQQPLSEIRLVAEDDRELIGFMGIALRRRRFFWNCRLAPQRFTLAVHDAARNRISVVEADDPSLARDVARTVGLSI